MSESWPVLTECPALPCPAYSQQVLVYVWGVVDGSTSSCSQVLLLFMLQVKSHKSVVVNMDIYLLVVSTNTGGVLISPHPCYVVSEASSMQCSQPGCVLLLWCTEAVMSTHPFPALSSNPIDME